MVSIKGLKIFCSKDKASLEDVDIEVDKGECILFCGPSGSGKTSLLNTINGVALNYSESSYEGSLLVDGYDVEDLELYELARIISSVFQNPKTHFFNIDTTTELLFYLENRGVAREEMDRRLEELLKIFPIEDLLDRNIFKLSGGQKQILSIASSYIAGTKVLVLDEPSSNLDSYYTELLATMLKTLKDRGRTILIAEHRLYYLMDLVDKVYYIRNGSLEEKYPIDDFLKLKDKKLKSLGLRSLKKSELKASKLGKDIRGDMKLKKLSHSLNEDIFELENLTFKLGEVYGIIGSNGVGKTSFIKSFIGLNKKSREDLLLDGKRLKKRQRVALSSWVMQDVNHQLFTDSVYSEVTLGLENPDTLEVERVLKALNLWHLRDRHPMSLSGGEKQRVAIASVILSKDKIIFFDEPTSGMDYGNMLSISELIRSISNEENIIFIVSHDLEFLNLTVDYYMDFDQIYRARSPL